VHSEGWQIHGRGRSDRKEQTLIQHIKNFRTSGTLVPSSMSLVNRLLEGVDFSSALAIAELGPGTGCVTREILRRMRPDARLLSLELNPTFAEQCRSIGDPRLTLRCECASRLPEILAEEGIEGVDAVVSSLPLGMMDNELVERILRASRKSLRPGGRFMQYQYTLSHLKAVKEHYPSVALGFTPLNVPPAFVYTCAARAGEIRQRRRRPLLASAYGSAIAFMAVVARSVSSQG
jgi:phospholipid N-methyltransferase